MIPIVGAKINIFIILIILLSQISFVSAEPSDSDFETATIIDPDTTWKGTIKAELNYRQYFKIETEIGTDFIFEFQDFDQQWLSFCIYDAELGLMDCIQEETAYGGVISYRNRATSEAYLVEVYCSECEWGEWDGPEYAISAQYTENNDAFTMYMLIGIVVMIAIGVVLFRKSRAESEKAISPIIVERVVEKEKHIESTINSENSETRAVTSFQDSVHQGNIIGGDNIRTEVINDPEAIARAAIEAYEMGKQKGKES
jgi:hypothetical protein